MEINGKKLTRSRHDRQLGGVAAGLAEYFNIDVTLVRIIFVLLTLAGGPGLPLYVVLWIVMPEASDGDNYVDTNIEKPKNV